MDFVKGLAKQKPLLLESYSTVPSAIVRGESLVGITYMIRSSPIRVTQPERESRQSERGQSFHRIPLFVGRPEKSG